MKFKNSWLIWIPLILLLILIFPKSCGYKIPTTVDYRCLGFKTPFISNLDKSGNSQEWCSGICIQKSINIPLKNETNNQTLDQGPFSGMTDSFGKVIPALLLIFVIIGLIRWFSSFKKARGNEIRVYKSP